MGNARVIVVDDQMVARGYFEAIVAGSTRYELSGSFGNAEAACAHCATRHVDLVILDVVMRHGMDGLSAAATIKALERPPRIVMVTSMPEVSWMTRARKLGVESFWYKEYADRPLLEVMDATMDGVSVYPDAPPPVEVGEALSADLTDQELVVLREMTTGATNAEIARRLGVSVHTVRTHVRHLLDKTGSTTRTQLAVNASRSGLVVADVRRG